MNTTTAKCTDLHFDPANVRKHNERNLTAIKASLERFGQQKPIVVDARNVVVAGNGTLEAAIALGWTEVSVVRTELVGADAVAYSIADNRAGDLATWDDAALNRVLNSIPDDLLVGLGWSDAECNSALASVTAELHDLGFDNQAPDNSSDAVSDEPEFDDSITGIISYKIIFDDDDQRDAWVAVVKWLKEVYPDAPTLGARLECWLASASKKGWSFNG